MPTSTFFALPAERRARLVTEAIVEFSDRTYKEASLSQIAVRSRIPKGSFYQYFEDKLDLYRWLLIDEAPRQKRSFLGASAPNWDFFTRLEHHIERGMAFLVEHPRMARLSAAAADPSGIPEVRGLHQAICEAGLHELRALLEDGRKAGAIDASVDLDVATRLVATIIGPGLTDVVLSELGAELHEVLASDDLRAQLGPRRRRRLAQETVRFIRAGLGAAPTTQSPTRKGTSA
jgi:AcrR family transcriptional regulator